MRKRFSFIIVMMMIVAFGLAGAVSVSAAPVDKTPVKKQTLNTMLQAGQTDNGEKAQKHTALVMFRSTEKISKKEAKKTLQLGANAVDDIQIGECWNFEREPEHAQSASAGQMKASAAEDSCASVALVTSESLSTEQLIRKLKARDDVLYAEPNTRIHAASVDDPYFAFQWSMQNGDNTPNVMSVWGDDNQGTTGSDRIVAIMDTGLDYTHPDLAENLWQNTHYPELKGDCGYDFIGGDEDPMDENGHGTHCAGIIGACGNNGVGISGVNQKIRFMALRILNSEGSAWLAHEVAAYNYISKALDLGEPIQAINNSWGGGDDSRIFAELIDIVGEKGAVSVMAAGNEGLDLDEWTMYPASIDSPYMIRVAATRPDGKLVSFSNYGTETVDVAAPGTDILSTVSYNCYNPSIYDGETQAAVSAAYNNYESEAGWESVSEITENLYLNGKPYDGSGTQKISITRKEGGFDEFTSGIPGHAVDIKAENLKEGDLVCVSIPYELDPAQSEAPYYSVMVRAEGSFEESGIIGAVEAPLQSGMDAAAISDLDLEGGFYIQKGDFDNWSHMDFQTLDEEELDDIREKAAGDPEALKRKIVLLLYAERDGDLHANIDDMGLSRQDLPEGEKSLGKYEFMSGTSMATPYITGAAALYAASKDENFDSEGAMELVGDVVSMAKESDPEHPLPIRMKGSFDFTRMPAEKGPRIGKIKVDKAAGTITITGTGLDPTGGLTVEIGPDKKHLTSAEYRTISSEEILVKDQGWINNVEYIRLTGYKGQTSTRSDLYMIGGKKQYTEQTDIAAAVPEEAMTTDGRRIFMADSNGQSVQFLDTKKPESGLWETAYIDTEEIFGKSENPRAQTAMKFGRDLVYMNGKLYSVLEYGEADELDPNEAGEDDWIIVDDEEEESSFMSNYSSEFRLVSIDVKSGKVKNLGRLPSDLNSTADYTMAAYNGKLMFIGGYSYKTAGPTADVKVFDPSKKEGKGWSDGKALPQVRAGGRALQSGSKLIYTMGYDQPLQDEEYNCPANLIFDGKTWKTSALGDGNIRPLQDVRTVVRGNKPYPECTARIAPAKGGLVYMGMPAADYGDTFVYNASSDSYADTGYNYIASIDEAGIQGIAVGDKIYGFNDGSVYTAPLTAGSGFAKITVKKNKGGTVSGDTTIPCGNDAAITLKAKKGYGIKSIIVNGKSVKVTNAKKQAVAFSKLISDQTVKVTFGKFVTVTVKKNKGGTVSGKTYIPAGSTAKLTVKAKKGYKIRSIKAGGKKVKVKNNKKQTVTIKKLKKNQTLQVKFKKK